MLKYSIGTLLIRASSIASKLAATPNAITVVPGVTDAIAISLFVTSPVSLTNTFTVTIASSSSRTKSRRARVKASADPCTSALTTTIISRRSFWKSPPNVAEIEPIRLLWYMADSFSRAILCRFAARSLAVCSSSQTTRISPAEGIPSKPTTLIGVLGPASFTLVLPSVLMSALTLPYDSPATKMSPILIVPFWINVVATVPRPR
mmetsp:Transcript_10686/g.15258  ORF Transcript_10686/g.15258 Transcript_10686/m.15258 type:complete len:205 (-) Transcript_10686:1204-1818(-)